MNKQRSFPRLAWGLLLLFSFLFVVPPAMAENTESMTVAQTFDDDVGYHKIMVEAQSGNRYFVWYYNAIGVTPGNTVVITFDDYNNWKTITNTANGEEEDIHKVLKVN